MQALDVLLMQGDSVFTEIGGMSWYRGSVDMKTNMPGGLLGGLGRAVAGESLFLTTYTASSDQATVTFTPEAPGSIVARDLAAGSRSLPSAMPSCAPSRAFNWPYTSRSGWA